ncbi:uncharacterized protein CDAR_68921 [Caerostris darwini]|uniref:Ig-like domain-containing protein n=1 Tax=Caerostris darwini TaxID=1538125 RepID=A0AAV4SXQ3_9ARAC|nr:uncharacterized protein CDAR_68921 [Caerostris darwini]
MHTQNTIIITVVEATIWEGSLLYIKNGSPVNLTCYVQDPMGTVFLFWYHNGNVIDEGVKRSRQIEVVTEMGTTTMSRLYIAKATQEDSGNYSCHPSYAEPANITLQVLNGQKPAAVQHGRQAGLVVRASFSVILFMNILILI